MEVTLPMPPGDCEKQTPAEVKVNIGVVAIATGQAALLDLAASTGTCTAKATAQDGSSTTARAATSAQAPAQQVAGEAGQESGIGKDNFVVSLAFNDTVTPAQSASAVEAASAVIADGDFCVSLGVGGATRAVAPVNTPLKKANVTQGTRTAIIPVADTPDISEAGDTCRQSTAGAPAVATREVAALLGVVNSVALAIACVA